MRPAKQKTAGTKGSDRLEIWLPFVEAYRTMCVAPSPDFRQVLEGVRHLKIAA